MKVLIVEDSMLVASAIRIVLKNEGIESSITSEGRKVVDMVKSEGINLIILDLMMPDFSGVDVFKELKKDKSTKDTKILILTAKADAMRWYPELKGCDLFMVKPFDNNELASNVKKLLKTK